MHVLVPELDSKEREFIVVSVTQRTEETSSKSAKESASAK